VSAHTPARDLPQPHLLAQGGSGALPLPRHASPSLPPGVGAPHHAKITRRQRQREKRQHQPPPHHHQLLMPPPPQQQQQQHALSGRGAPLRRPPGFEMLPPPQQPGSSASPMSLTNLARRIDLQATGYNAVVRSQRSAPRHKPGLISISARMFEGGAAAAIDTDPTVRRIYHGY